MTHRPRARRLRRALLATIALALLAPAGASAAATATDFRLVYDRHYEVLTGWRWTVDYRDADMGAKLRALNDTAARYSSTMAANPTTTRGLWNEAGFTWDPTRDTRRADPDPAAANYERLRTMALALATECTGMTGCLEGDATLARNLYAGLDWLDRNWYGDHLAAHTPGDDGWYGWRLGIPLKLLDIMVLTRIDLTNNGLMDDLLAAIDHHIFQRYEGNVIDGANRAWQAQIYLLWGALNGGVDGETRVDLAISGVPRLLNLINTVGTDGWWDDGTFIDHNWHPYNGGYGQAYLGSVVTIIHLLADHPLWEITDSDVPNVVRWARDDASLIYRGAMFDMVRGRNTSDMTNQDHNTGAMILQLFPQIIDIADAYGRTADARSLGSFLSGQLGHDRGWFTDSLNTAYHLVRARDIVADTTNYPPTTGRTEVRHYSAGYKSVMHRPNFGLGISMNGWYTENYEDRGLVGDNLWHSADGYAQLYLGDDLTQFTDYWPTVNAYRLSGTTVHANSTMPPNRSNNETWSGGVTDTENGTAGFDMRLWDRVATNYPLRAKKSWFMFDDEIVALGSDITDASNPANTMVETIVDNRKLNANGDNAFTVDGTAKLTTTGAATCRTTPTTREETVGWSESMRGVRWMWLDGNTPSQTSELGYFFPTATDVVGRRVRGCGRWSDIDDSGIGTRTLIQNHYLETYIQHGTNPVAGRYAYVLLPGFNSNDTRNYATTPEITVLKHDNTVHAVTDSGQGMVGANFWTAGSFDNAGIRPWLRSDAAAAVFVHRTGGNLYVRVSDPTQMSTGTIRLTFGIRVSANRTIDSAFTVNSRNPLTLTLDLRNQVRGTSYRAHFTE